jgi:hypothetical protein
MQSQIKPGEVEALVYHFPNGTTVEIDAPSAFTVVDSGDHLVVDFTGVGTVVPRGWHKIEVFPEFGHGPFGGKVERRVEVEA